MQRYAHDPGCLMLSDTDNFVPLLSAIRQHLYRSIETQSYYVSIAQEIQDNLGGIFQAAVAPCLDDFQSFVVNGWPTFRSIQGSVDTILWGRLSKGQNSLYEVGILNSLIAAAEVVS
jgi:hypothetical protein